MQSANFLRRAVVWGLALAAGVACAQTLDFAQFAVVGLVES